MKLYPGLAVLYRLRPGQTRMGQQDLAAIVTRVAANDRLDLIAFPPKTGIVDALMLENVAPMSQEITGHCWHAPPDESAEDVAALRVRIDELETMLDDLTGGRPPTEAEVKAMVGITPEMRGVKQAGKKTLQTA